MRGMSELIRVSRGLWRPAEAVADLSGRCAALLEALPVEAIIGGWTAAELHGLWMPPKRDERIEVVLCRAGELPRALAHTERDEVLMRRYTLRADEICFVQGLPVTTEERTWVDLAGRLPLTDLVACGDSVLRGELRSGLGLDEMLRRARGRRGIRRARDAAALVDARSRSRPESHLRVAVVTGGLPAPEVNTAIVDEHGQWLAEPDLHYERPRLALEYQGEEHADVYRMRNDITREIDVVDHDWLSVPFGPAQVFGRPWTIAPLVRRLIHRRAPGWLREWRVSQRVAGYSPPLAR
jgi:hypothetical protein